MHKIFINECSVTLPISDTVKQKNLTIRFKYNDSFFKIATQLVEPCREFF